MLMIDKNSLPASDRALIMEDFLHKRAIPRTVTRFMAMSLKRVFKIGERGE